MSFESVEGQRRDTADAILAKVGAHMEKAEQRAAARSTDPATRKLMAARMALEYAVLATAREKNMATQVVATALANATAVQQAAMLKEGSAALGRAYKVEPEVLVNVFAGRLAEVPMPKGQESTPAIDKMVDACRSLVTTILKDDYTARAQLAADGSGGGGGGGGGSDSFIAPRSEGVVSPARTELAARLAFMEASIDAATGKGAIAPANADLLKARIEDQVFQPRPPQSLQFSTAFKAFFEERGKGIRIDAMTEVRGVVQSLTVQEIAAKLKAVMPPVVRAAGPDDHRAHKPMER